MSTTHTSKGMVIKMNHYYGYFDPEQFEAFKVKWHKEIHWLLLYKDPKTAEEYSYVDYKKYYEGLMRRINGLSALLFYPPEIVSILSNLEAAYLETQKSEFDFQVYRKLILDAHALVDKIKVSD